MTSRKLIPVTLVAALALAATGTAAFAGSRDRDINDATVMANAKITLAQAVTLAEQQAAGRAVSADLRHAHGQPSIVVEVAAKDGTHKVLVDPATGKITANAIDHEGRGEDGSEDD